MIYIVQYFTFQLQGMKNLQLTAVFVEGEYWYTAYLKELPGVISQGESIEKAEENLYDALELYLEPDISTQVETNQQSFTITTKPFISLRKTVWKKRILKST